ncbi:MAG: mechanosensitive ion channel family protein [Eubacterium sp.]|jgi:small-conductance mechanosensitive channel|nr:mechanosensitive ion channel family protein [Eubacterium sp.]
MDSVIKIGLFILAELLLNRVVNLVFRIMSRKHNSVHLRFIKSILNVLIVIVVLYSLAQQFEVTKDISKTLLQSSSLFVAIATFAAQQALSNVISGISLSFSKPYNVDEKIRVVQGSSVIAEGIVKDITIRHTIIQQFNGESCIVPNSVMDSAVITNTNYTGNIGNFMEIEISYEADIEKAKKCMQEICIANKLTLNTEENKVFVKGYTQNGIILKTTVWTENLDDSFLACSDIRAELVEGFRKNGILIPYQTVVVHHTT